MGPGEQHRHVARRYVLWPELASMDDEEILLHLTYRQAPHRRRVLEDEADLRGLTNTR